MLMSSNIIISNNNKINKFWVDIFTGQGHINQVYYTGVRDLVSDKGSQWSDSGPIKTKYLLLLSVLSFFYIILSCNLSSPELKCLFIVWTFIRWNRWRQCLHCWYSLCWRQRRCCWHQRRQWNRALCGGASGETSKETSTNDHISKTNYNMKVA